MNKRPNLASVAERAGVSVPTVSQVMRGTGRISEQTRKKVLKAAKELHYVRDGRAASMRSGKSLEVGFVVNQIANPFNAEVISGVSDRLRVDGYLVSVLDGADDADLQAQHLASFIESGRAGLLWVPAAATARQTYEMLAVNRTPVVTFMRSSGQHGFDHVGIRNGEATQTATQHLLDLGHRHIAYLGGDDSSSVRKERVEGFTQKIDACGLDHIVWPCPDTKAAGAEAIVALKAAHPDVSAIVCNGDMVALGACVGAARMGLSIGPDLSVIGFDDIEDARLAIPALTTMSTSPYQLGRRLASVLLDRLCEPELPTTISEVTAELVIRETTQSPNAQS